MFVHLSRKSDSKKSFGILRTSDAAQKMKFSIKDFFSKFTEEILNGKLHSLCSEKILQLPLIVPQLHNFLKEVQNEILETLPIRFPFLTLLYCYRCISYYDYIIIIILYLHYYLFIIYLLFLFWRDIEK